MAGRGGYGQFNIPPGGAGTPGQLGAHDPGIRPVGPTSIGGPGGAGSSLYANALLGTSVGSTLAGSIMGAIGSIQGGKAAEAAAKYNAAIAEMAGNEEEYRRRRLARRALSAQFTQMAGKSGVLAEEGGWLEALARNAGEYEMDAVNAGIAGRQTAALERARGKSARRAGQIRAGASLISGASRVAGMGLQLYKPGAS